MMIGRHGDSPIETLIGERQSSSITLHEGRLEIELLGVFEAVSQHSHGKVEAIQPELLGKRQEVSPMSTTNIKQVATCPSLGQIFELRPEDAPMATAVPARCHTIEDFFLINYHRGSELTAKTIESMGLIPRNGPRLPAGTLVTLKPPCYTTCEGEPPGYEVEHPQVSAYMRKLTRTISGVTPVAVMAEPMGCPGKCVYCPTYSTAPQSYTPESPAVQRARAFGYDPFKQAQFRLKVLAEMGHPTDKVELIVMGGTFLAASEEYQRHFVKACYDALNGRVSSDLEDAKTLNETSSNRCVGLCIETRPDWCGPREIQRMLDFGATRVELGVQMLDDEIYRVVKRGHLVQDVVDASRLLRNSGFKVHYHWMPGLPGSTPERDLVLSKRLFEDPCFRPDGLKIYPTMVVEGTELQRWFDEGLYRPYDNGVMTDLVVSIKAEVPKYVRISRVLRDIPSKYIVGGLKDSLRDVVQERLRARGTQCHCIRCREYGHRSRRMKPGQPSLARLDYEASGGREVFLSFEDDAETLFGLLRLRIQTEPIESVTAPAAIVRELHVYGPEVSLNDHPGTGAQHQGLGHSLLVEAEKIARDEFGASHLLVLSAVGARPYYSDVGYGKMGPYMAKAL